jgi:tetratricopeptide (TPR) repeat protein
MRADLREKEADYAGAAADYTALIDLDPDSPSLAQHYAARAAAHLKLKDDGSAVSDYNKSLDLEGSLSHP